MKPFTLSKSHCCGVLCALLLAAIGGGCAKSHHVIPLHHEAAKEVDGVTYALPLTVVATRLTLKLTVTEKSVFAGYCATKAEERAEALGIPFAKEDKRKLEIVDAKIATTSEADPNRSYIVELGRNPLQTRKLVMELTNLGVITSAGSEVEDKTSDFVVSMAKAVGKVLVASAGLPAPADSEEAPESMGFAGCDETTRIENAYEEIIKVRKDKYELASGGKGANIHPESLKLMLAYLDEREQELAQLFSGETKVHVWSGSHVHRPTRDDIGKELPLLAYDPKRGVVRGSANTVLSLPKQYYYTPSEEDITEVQSLALNLSVQENEQLYLAAANAAPITKDEDRSFYYLIPAVATASLVAGGDTIDSAKIEVAQFGEDFSLPRTSLGRKTILDVDWHANGAIKQITAESTAQRVEQVEEVAGALAPLLQKSPVLTQAQEIDAQTALLQSHINRRNALLQYLGLMPAEEVSEETEED